MGRCRATQGAIVCAAAAVVASAAMALSAPAAQAARIVHPRMGAALGIVPAHGAQLEVANGTNFPVVYHGGSVMHGVTVHTVFWAPPGYSFSGSPRSGVAGYIALIQQFFADVARDSGSAQNVFSVLGEYPDGLGPAGYRVTYSPAADSFYDTQPYPARSRQCASPAGVATCVTDLQVQQEIDRVRDSVPAGLNDVWFVFLPPDVDECTSSGNCGSSVFAGYHSFGDVGHGERVYVVVPDPLIEYTPSPGSDPQGNPEAEATILTAAHELVESITDPEGAGWMDPNGFEVADKCDVGPQPGTPLGFGADGSPYNQVIGGDIYLLEAMWSNAAGGCVQRSSSVLAHPGLPTISLTQFSPSIRGNIGSPTRGVDVFVTLWRAKRFVALADATSRADGSWGPVSLAPHAVGDDRDQLLILYGRGGPPADVIDTGDGGDPFSESGFTGWFDLDHGYRVRKDSVELAPCSQVGVLGLSVGRSAAPSPLERCETETNITSVATGPLRSGTQLRMSSEDNRAISTRGLNGALVSMTVPLGEPGAVPAVGNNQVPYFRPSGFPLCTADLGAQLVSCQGLVRGARYRLFRRRGHFATGARATRYGRLRSARFSIRGGDVITLRNAAGRVLTVLHVARLRVNVNGRQTVIASGRCQPGDYFGPPPSTPPISDGVDEGGLENTGKICPDSGSARGLPSTGIEQTDDLSGGLTRTEVPQLAGFSPSAGATLYGPFVALATAGIPGAHGSTSRVPGATVSVTITRNGSGRPAFSAANVATAQGARVARLPPGVYHARWVVRDASGDTRTVQTRFVEEP